MQIKIYIQDKRWMTLDFCYTTLKLFATTTFTDLTVIMI